MGRPYPFARAVREFESLDSTSTTARSIVASEDVALPLLVVAREQTAGRGRGDHTWWSGRGSLAFTLALDPKAHGLAPHQEPRVALGAALLVAQTIDDGSIGKVGVRWPNDVECRGRKIAGILPERVETPGGPRLLVGIGVNVANRFEDAPDSIRAIASSIADAGIAEVPSPSVLLDRLLDGFAAMLAGIAADDPRIAAQWRERDVLVGRPLRLLVDGRVIAGDGAGIAPDGGLILRSPGLGERVFYGGRLLKD